MRRIETSKLLYLPYLPHLSYLPYLPLYRNPSSGEGVRPSMVIV
jgi:hypothetical protein